MNEVAAVVADGLLIGWLMNLFPDWLHDGLCGCLLCLFAWVSALVLGRM